MHKSEKYCYKPLPEPILITEQQWPEETLPLVTTRTITYMHEPYIRECIEGILMQKTTFPVQVVIHDDASVDGTTAILREYEAKYPKLVKCFYESENTWNKPDRHKIWKPFTEAQVGKYIAFCEGDDYWTDPLKLQKQVVFLEANPEYILSFHDCIIIDEQSNEISNSKLGLRRKRDYSREELVIGNLVPTLSVLFRADQYKLISPKPNHIVNGDTWLFSNLGKYGKGHYHDDIASAVYRQHSGGIWSKMDNLTKYTNLINTYSELLKIHHAEHHRLFRQKIFRYSLQRFRLLKSKKEKIKFYLQVLSRIPINISMARNILKLHYYLLFG